MVTTEGHAPCSAAQLQSPTPPHLCLLTPHRCRYPPRVQPTLLPVLGYLRPCWPRSLLAPRATRRPVWARMVWASMAWASMAWACPRRASRVSWTMMMARRGPARRPQLQPRQGPFPERPAPGRPPRGLWQQQRLWQQRLHAATSPRRGTSARSATTPCPLPPRWPCAARATASAPSAHGAAVSPRCPTAWCPLARRPRRRAAAR